MEYISDQKLFYSLQTPRLKNAFFPTTTYWNLSNTAVQSETALEAKREKLFS